MSCDGINIRLDNILCIDLVLPIGILCLDEMSLISHYIVTGDFYIKSCITLVFFQLLIRG